MGRATRNVNVPSNDGVIRAAKIKAVGIHHFLKFRNVGYLKGVSLASKFITNGI